MAEWKRRMIVNGWIVSGLFGALAYLAVAGFAPLDVTNVGWIFHAGDIATAQTGWDFYRHAPWSARIALNPAYGMDYSGSIIFSDAVPLLAIPFKALSPLLPEPFQYFGLWTFASFVLQGVFGWALMSRATENPVARILGAILISLTPLYCYRLVSCTHMSLTAHWMVLAGLCLCLPPHTRRPWLWWGLLLAAAAFTHIYLFAMVAALWCADLARRAFLDPRKTWPEPLGVGAALAALIWATGIWSGPAGVHQGGFGWFKMNVFALFDPDGWTSTAIDRPGWSYILPDLPNWGGDFEGFAFLGLGGIALIAIAIWFARPAWRGAEPRRLLPYAPLAAALVGMAIFALSQNVTFGDKNFYVWWPQPLQTLGELFRSTGRFIWPFYYFLFFAAVFLIARHASARTLTIVLAFVSIVQGADTARGWLHDSPYLHVRGGAYVSKFTAPFWDEAGARYRAVRVAPHSLDRYLDIAAYARAHAMTTDAAYLSRTSTDGVEATRVRTERAIATGHWPSDTLFILDEPTARRAAATLDRARNVLARVDGVIVLAPGWAGCADCGAAPYR
jgi:hypothetical protein